MDELFQATDAYLALHQTLARDPSGQALEESEPTSPTDTVATVGTQELLTLLEEFTEDANEARALIEQRLADQTFHTDAASARILAGMIQAYRQRLASRRWGGHAFGTPCQAAAWLVETVSMAAGLAQNGPEWEPGGDADLFPLS